MLFAAGLVLTGYLAFKLANATGIEVKIVKYSLKLSHRVRHASTRIHSLRLCRPRNHSFGHPAEPRDQRTRSFGGSGFPLYALRDERSLVFRMVFDRRHVQRAHLLFSSRP